MKPYLLLVAIGLALSTVVALFGGWAAGAGGVVATAAQVAAVVVVRPVMGATNDQFVPRLLAGMGIRAAAVFGLVIYAAQHRSQLALLPAALGCLGVLLPLLFTENRFLK